MLKYRELITSAVQIVLHHKYLWFFGLFTAFLSNSGAYKSLYGGEPAGTFAEQWQALQATGIFQLNVFATIARLVSEDPWGVAWRLLVLAVVLVLGLFIFWLTVVSQGALVASVAKLNAKKKTDFQDGLQTGKEKFWPVLFLNILEKGLIAALVIATFFAALLVFRAGNPFALGVAYNVLLVIIAAVITLIIIAVKYSIAYSVIRDLRFIEALQSGFALLRRNFVVSIEAGIVILVLNFLLSLGIIVFAAALAIPFVFLLLFFSKMQVAFALTATLFAGIVTLFVAVTVVGAMVTALNEAFWTLVFVTLLRTRPGSWLRSLLVNVRQLRRPSR